MGRSATLLFSLHPASHLGKLQGSPVPPCPFPLPSLLHRLLNRFGSKQSQDIKSSLHSTAYTHCIALCISHSTFNVQRVLTPWNRPRAIDSTNPAQRLRQYRSNLDHTRLFFSQSQQVAHEQVNTQGTPAIPFDACV